MTDEPELEFFIEEAVLDRLDELADVQLEEGWRDDAPDTLLVAVARLDEAMAEAAADAGVKHASMDEGMKRLVYELHRRKDWGRYSAARVADEVMQAGMQYAAAKGARDN